MERQVFEALPMGTHIIVTGAYGFGDESDTELIFMGLNPDTKQYDMLYTDESENGMSFPVEVVEALASKSRLVADEPPMEEKELGVIDEARTALIHAGNHMSVHERHHELADECHRLSMKLSRMLKGEGYDV